MVLEYQCELPEKTQITKVLSLHAATDISSLVVN